VDSAEGFRSDPVLVLSKDGSSSQVRLADAVRAGSRRARTLRTIVRNAHADPPIDGRPLVSVVLATYNWSNVLRQAMRSVLRQTYVNFELLVIGDGCTDDSEQVVTSFRDRRVRWHNLKENTGSQAIPNNTGLELARGEFIAYQGHDDVWHPRHLSRLVASLQTSGADLAFSLAEVLGPPGSRVRYLTGLVRGNELGPGNWLPPNSIMHRAELGRRVGGWRNWKEAGGAPDIRFLDRVIESGARLIRVPALTAFKFPSSFRKNSYLDRPSHEQEAYVTRIARERLFVERELVRLALRRVSPLKERLHDRPSEKVTKDPEALYSFLRRARGLD
jgi:glycosyltransferase involved in cell wall biosynthesis